MWVEFVVDSSPCSKGFLWILWFPSLHKYPHSKFQFNLETVDRKSHLVECPVKSLFLKFNFAMMLALCLDSIGNYCKLSNAITFCSEMLQTKLVSVKLES